MGGDSVLILIAGEHSVLRQYQPLNLLTTFGRSFNENEDRAHFTVGQGAINRLLCRLR